MGRRAAEVSRGRPEAGVDRMIVFETPNGEVTVGAEVDAVFWYLLPAVFLDFRFGGALGFRFLCFGVYIAWERR